MLYLCLSSMSFTAYINGYVTVSGQIIKQLLLFNRKSDVKKSFKIYVLLLFNYGLSEFVNH